MSCAAGVSLEFQIENLITSKDSNLRYLRQLTFGTASSCLLALVESFPSEKVWLEQASLSNQKIIKDILFIIFKHCLKFQYRLIPIALADYLGRLVGHLKAAHSTEKQWVYKLVTLLDLE